MVTGDSLRCVQGGEIVRRLDGDSSYPVANDLALEAEWAEGLGAEGLADALRSAVREEYANASSEEMRNALEAIMGSMTAAEAFNFKSALDRMGKSAGRVLSDPTFIQVASTAAPIVLGAAGMAVGGPAGAALGAGLGNLAASALSARAAPSPAAAQPVAAAPPQGPPTPTAAQPVVPAQVPTAPAAASPPEILPPAPIPASSVAGGSAAAARALVLANQPDVLRSLLAAALGQSGSRTSSGIPIAQVVTLFSEAVGQAAADADELMYLEQQPGAMESVNEAAYTDSAGSLYADLLGADNRELAEAAGWEGLD
jgi:hypothetical protein